MLRQADKQAGRQAVLRQADRQAGSAQAELRPVL